MRISPYTGSVTLDRGDEVVVERMARLAACIAGQPVFSDDIREMADKANEVVVDLLAAINAVDEDRDPTKAETKPNPPKARRTRRKPSAV